MYGRCRKSPKPRPGMEVDPGNPPAWISVILQGVSPPPFPLARRYSPPPVASWFEKRFGAPTEPQARAWPEIRAGRHTLIAAPTGSGKTLAAFLSAIDGLVRQALVGDLKDETQVVYVSPLKA